MNIIINIPNHSLVSRGVITGQKWLPGGYLDWVFHQSYDEGTGDRINMTFGNEEICHVINIHGAPYDADNPERDAFQEWYNFIDDAYAGNEEMRLEARRVMEILEHTYEVMTREFIRLR